MTCASYETELRNLARSGAARCSDECFEVKMRATVPRLSELTVGEVLHRVTEVLASVVGARANSVWPDFAHWKSGALPSWFLDRCTPTLSDEEEQAWLEQWRTASAEGRRELERAKGWALEEWLYWFADGPDERRWRWKRGEVVGGTHLDVTLCVPDWPTPLGALVWTLTAAGASDVELLED